MENLSIQEAVKLLAYPLFACKAFEDSTDLPILGFAEGKGDYEKVSSLSALIWAGLLQYKRDLTIDELQQWLDRTQSYPLMAYSAKAALLKSFVTLIPTEEFGEDEEKKSLKS